MSAILESREKKLREASMEKYLSEVTQIYLKSGKPFPRDREKHLQERNFKTKYKLYDLDEKKFSKATKAGYSEKFSNELGESSDSKFSVSVATGSGDLEIKKIQQ
tara:strand:- start:2802 stop:3116 length:315 start_codon:yes stop_codon:yes gene_type:complete